MARLSGRDAPQSATVAPGSTNGLGGGRRRSRREQHRLTTDAERTAESLLQVVVLISPVRAGAALRYGLLTACAPASVTTKGQLRLYALPNAPHIGPPQSTHGTCMLSRSSLLIRRWIG